MTHPFSSLSAMNKRFVISALFLQFFVDGSLIIVKMVTCHPAWVTAERTPAHAWEVDNAFLEISSQHFESVGWAQQESPFDGIPNADPDVIAPSRYPTVRSWGRYVGWDDDDLLMRALNISQRFILNSLFVAAGRSSDVPTTITALSTTTVSLNLSPKTNFTLNWSDVNRLMFNSTGAPGIDNICLTFWRARQSLASE